MEQRQTAVLVMEALVQALAGNAQAAIEALDQLGGNLDATECTGCAALSLQPAPRPWEGSTGRRRRTRTW
ncbi:hypothetical protein [Streptomyces luteireticuli]|uniref:hypothetical protein n=1 Tax=Streptomyces luteireticuli TaxID=173858 RepID=UPI003556D10D